MSLTKEAILTGRAKFCAVTALTDSRGCEQVSDKRRVLWARRCKEGEVNVPRCRRESLNEQTHKLVDHTDHTLQVILSTEHDALRAILLDYEAFSL